MKKFKLTLLITLLISVNVFSQNKSIYEHWYDYLDDCNTLVTDSVTETGKLCIYKKIITIDTLTLLTYVITDTIWTEVKLKNFKFNDDNIHDYIISTNNNLYTNINYNSDLTYITRIKTYKLKKRKPTFNDFCYRYLDSIFINIKHNNYETKTN